MLQIVVDGVARFAYFLLMLLWFFRKNIILYKLKLPSAYSYISRDIILSNCTVPLWLSKSVSMKNRPAIGTL